MNEKLLINILKKLRDEYPESINATILLEEIGVNQNERDVNQNESFLQVISYLNETQKIHIKSCGNDEKNRANDEIRILPRGIDYLTEIRLLRSREKNNEILIFTTIAIALFALFQLMNSLFGSGETVILIHQLSDLTIYVLLFLGTVFVVKYMIEKVTMKLRMRN